LPQSSRLERRRDDDEGFRQHHFGQDHAAEIALRTGLRQLGQETTALSNPVETRYDPGLTHSTINQAGDFLYIPCDLPHQPINLSKNEPALAIVSRNDPNEQESVVHYEPGNEA
jgi:hypothetical protein